MNYLPLIVNYDERIVSLDVRIFSEEGRFIGNASVVFAALAYEQEPSANYTSGMKMVIWKACVPQEYRISLEETKEEMKKECDTTIAYYKLWKYGIKNNY